MSLYNYNPIILVDTNILLMAIKEHWHIDSIIETQIYENYKIIVPKFIIDELQNVKEKITVKNGALRLAKEIFSIMNDQDYLGPDVYSKPVDIQLLSLALVLNETNKTIVMTQDMALKDKIIKKGLQVLFVSYGKGKLLKAE